MSYEAPSFTGPTEQVDYPFLAIRYTPDHIKKESIVFVKRSEKEFIAADDASLVIAVPDEFDESDGCVEMSRDVIIESAALHMGSVGYPLCVVFAPDDCAYIEHDGTVTVSRQLPFHADENWC